MKISLYVRKDTYEKLNKITYCPERYINTLIEDSVKRYNKEK